MQNANFVIKKTLLGHINVALPRRLREKPKHKNYKSQ